MACIIAANTFFHFESRGPPQLAIGAGVTASLKFAYRQHARAKNADAQVPIRRNLNGYLQLRSTRSAPGSCFALCINRHLRMTEASVSPGLVIYSEKRLSLRFSDFLA